VISGVNLPLFDGLRFPDFGELAPFFAERHPFDTGTRPSAERRHPEQIYPTETILP